MDSAAFRQLLRRLVSLPFLVLLPFSAILVISIYKLEQSAKWVDHTDQVLTRASLTLRNIIDQETGVRGYISTGNREFLQPYESAQRTFPSVYQQTYDLVGDNAGQQERLRKLKSDYDTWVEISRRTLDDTDLTSEEVAAYSVEGKRLMDTIRREMAEFVSEEEHLRGERSANTTRALHRAYWFTAAFSILGVLILASAIDRSVRKLNRAYSSQLAAVFEEQQWLETTLRGIGDAVVACDAEGYVVFMNPVAEICTGWSESEAKGHSLDEVFRIVNEETRNSVESPVRKVMRTGTVVGLANHTVLIRKDGTEISIDDSGAPIRDRTGKIIGIVLVFRDISEDRLAEKALIRSEKLATAGRLAATIAHEVNNPLESATNLVFLAQSSEISEQARHYLVAADAELRRVSHLTRQSLAFYREPTNAQQFRPAQTIRQVVELYRVRVASRDIAIRAEVDEALEIQGYEGELRQVLANLIGNSYDAIRDSGQILVRAKMIGNPGNALVRFTVADNGVGIPVLNRPRIFEAFFTTKADVGTGLGLWVTKNILEKRGGHIRVRSRSDGTRSYTVVSFSIPAEPAKNSIGSLS